jgi:catechol 2,3-dioxygenase-like lactoylglutathione lyase family enzyme
MKEGRVMHVELISSVAVITPDPKVSRQLYLDALGLSLAEEADNYLHTEDLDGSRSLGIWPLTQAAQACFEIPDWPVDRPAPHVSIEFEVSDADGIQLAPDELEEQGFTFLHQARTQRWGQTVARLQSKRGRDHRPVLHAIDA